jgi:hypothetical protein
MIQYFLAIVALATSVYAGSDTILAHAKLPNALMTQAEIFVIQRGSEAVVKTRIDTRFSKKVHRKIAKTEQKNWGENLDVKAYLKALDAAFAEYEKQGRKQPLLIEWVAVSNGYRVDFRFSTTTVWRTLPLSAAYVQKNQEYIIQKAFGKKANQLIQKLRTLNPIEKKNEKL